MLGKPGSSMSSFIVYFLLLSHNYYKLYIFSYVYYYDVIDLSCWTNWVDTAVYGDGSSCSRKLSDILKTGCIC